MEHSAVLQPRLRLEPLSRRGRRFCLDHRLELFNPEYQQVPRPIDIHLCIYIYTCIHISICMYVCMHACTHVCVYINIYTSHACVCVCVYILICWGLGWLGLDKPRPWVDPESRSTLWFCHIHHRNIPVHNWVCLLNPPGGLGFSRNKRRSLPGNPNNLQKVVPQTAVLLRPEPSLKEHGCLGYNCL